MLTEAEIARLAQGWGSKETRCGRGSMIEHTVSVREYLPGLVTRYGVQSVCDAGAGDLNWITHVAWDVEYRPFDVVIRHPSVTLLDVTANLLPKCDLILCRMVLNHLKAEHVKRAIALFQQSGRYLLATQCVPEKLNTGNFVEYDLRNYGLDEPLESFPDAHGDLALWRL